MENEMETGGILDLLTIVVSLIISIPVSTRSRKQADCFGYHSGALT